MGKYASNFFERPKKKETNPLWTGIGCLLMIIVPIFSFGLAYVTIDLAGSQGWPLPQSFYGSLTMPGFLYSNPIAPYISPIFGIPNTYGYIVFTLLYIVLVGGLVSFLFSLFYRLSGHSQYGPTDVLPEARKVKRYKR